MCGNECVSTKTKFGQLVAEISADPDNPAIWISLIPQEGIPIVVATIESTNDQEPNRQLRVILWENPRNEDSTRTIVLSEFREGETYE